MNDDSTQLREAYVPQPATAIASHLVRPEMADEYIEAQTAITEAARMSPGFVGTEVLSPIPDLQGEWVAIFRLESNLAMKRWLESPERARLAARIEACLSEPSHMLLLASDDNAEPPVAVVFTHRVAKDKEEAYLAWRRKVIAAQAHYPGYLATEFFRPHGIQNEWVDIVRYDNVDDLNHWMESKEREALLKELDPIVESMHAHRVTGLEGWFALNRGAAATVRVPPSWKQMLSVLFALYPTVMVLNFLTPLWHTLPFPQQMLIGNILSCALLTYLVMPRVSQFLNFWLTAPVRDWKNEALGVGAVLAGLALFVFIFQSI
ncbi:MAG: antibiotic biosynthesis monooxygenase [Candidatus Binatus sp.]|uniref:antibiotic biosynthesis monooxygenase n=1 Tax=Candidatus Binatus sp. TaxID=2811406 RepID=UPI002727AFFF|nr:antibiotic biosynthesis monooxygenase [Candidatus Binatus sp.]MDO8432463.1 antibiotic biosynthesis monooxygenase [Candidatus Binatus sp.]